MHIQGDSKASLYCSEPLSPKPMIICSSPLHHTHKLHAIFLTHVHVHIHTLTQTLSLQVLKVLLPEGMEVPHAFDQVGHIAHLNLRDVSCLMLYFVPRDFCLSSLLVFSLPFTILINALSSQECLP
jgi:hypothetical protein